MEINWFLVLAALGVGLLVGLTGVGAGALMTPLLVGVFGVSLPVAIATDLLFATITKLVGVPFHHRSGSINWDLTKRLWWGSIPGTLVGVGVVVFVVSREQTEWLMWPLFAIVFLTALTMGYRAVNQKPPAEVLAVSKGPHRLAAPVGGSAIGITVAMTSVGAGALGMALLVRLSPPWVRPRELVGTDLVHAIPLAMISGLVYGSAGLVSLTLLLTMLAGSIPGVLAGSRLSGWVSSNLLNACLSVTLLFAAGLVLFRLLP